MSNFGMFGVFLQIMFSNSKRTAVKGYFFLISPVHSRWKVSNIQESSMFEINKISGVKHESFALIS